jgi:hypothetical protein
MVLEFCLRHLMSLTVCDMILYVRYSLSLSLSSFYDFLITTHILAIVDNCTNLIESNFV